MYRFDRIKLVIWDMDETFWQGTIAEGEVSIPNEHIKLIKDLTDAGIINSICSKNDFEIVISELKKYGLNEYFVFPSINWEPKGGRIMQLISDMQLRPANVLFIDDNPSNLGEAEHFCSEIMTSTPDIISRLINDVEHCEKKDLEHKRLKQYRLLEEKQSERRNYTSNEAFLMGSGIRVELGYDCETQIDRIHELILRSNQLNFTKIRSSIDDLTNLLSNDNYSCGYVSVTDNFGDYGIVGFYAKTGNRLEHFVFSCRTLGMGIEQYVYNLLGRPELSINGEVISDLSSTELPKWINQKNCEQSADKMEIKGIKQHKVLIKGPCDLFQVFPYIANTEMFDTEFTYTTDNGLVIESTGHTTHIVEAHRLSFEQKTTVVNEVPFADMGMYSDSIFSNKYKVAIISILADANLGVYRRKDTGERMAVMEYIHPLTDKSSWAGIISEEYPHTGFNFDEQILMNFSEKYEFVGRNDAKATLENLKYIREHLPDGCMLVIMLGGELYYEKNTFQAYMDRHVVHKEMNDLIREWAKEIPNVRLIDVNKYLIDQSSFYDHFNHYIKPIYYKIAGDIVNIVNEHIGSNIHKTSKLKMVKIRMKEMLAPIYYRLKKSLRR